MSRKSSRCRPSRVEPGPFETLIADVAAGRRKPERAWHQLRNGRPSLRVWKQFADATGRYDSTWAQHQFACWTELSTAGTYPEQRRRWKRKELAFIGAMADKQQRINAAIEASASARPPARKRKQPADQQLSLEIS